jgi:chemotaxis family two-component system sensor histidine kinase/response regulator PixL
MEVQREVLVVDDLEMLRELPRRFLEKAGYVVVTAEDGADALEQARVHPNISMILVDFEMPNLDGKQFTAAYRAEFGLRVPVIMTTSLADHMSEELRAQVHQAGVSEIHDKVPGQEITEFVNKAYLKYYPSL